MAQVTIIVPIYRVEQIHRAVRAVSYGADAARRRVYLCRRLYA